MSNSQEPKAARSRAEHLFTASERRDEIAKQEIAKERKKSDEKTAKLRALRLAKEAEDKAAADAEALANPPAKKASRTRAKKPAAV